MAATVRTGARGNFGDERRGEQDMEKHKGKAKLVARSIGWISSMVWSRAIGREKEKGRRQRPAWA